jgi:hypothetical protein
VLLAQNFGSDDGVDDGLDKGALDSSTVTLSFGRSEMLDLLFALVGPAACASTAEIGISVSYIWEFAFVGTVVAVIFLSTISSLGIATALFVVFKKRFFMRFAV